MNPATMENLMNVKQLRDLLKDLDGNLPILLATQPSWPMEHDLAASSGILDVLRQPRDGCDLRSSVFVSGVSIQRSSALIRVTPCE